MQSKNKRLSFLILTYLACTHLHAMNVGPFHLGMQNLEAKKHGQLTCAPQERSEDISCRGSFVNFHNELKPKYRLIFSKSGKLIEIVLWWAADRTTENRSLLIRQLSLQPCNPSLLEEDDLGFTCYANNKEKLRLWWQINRSWLRHPETRHWSVTLEFSSGQTQFEKFRKQKEMEGRKKKSQKELANSFSS